jgi:predicted nucleic acid-binding Zn ribbon protein
MATYQYRCDTDGVLDVQRPIGTAPAGITCPSCGAPSTRVFTPPMLGLADRGRMAVIDHAESSRYAPAVVSSVPATRRTGTRRPAPVRHPDPRTSTLPRP